MADGWARTLFGAVSFALSLVLGAAVFGLLLFSGGAPQFYGGPALMVAISVVYFLAASGAMSLHQRALTSAHGLVGGLIFAGAAALHLSGNSRPIYGMPFLLLHAVPLLLVAYSFRWYRGPQRIHLLQAPNLAAMAWSAFISAMAASGEWL